jgi:hypothetical protein
MVPQHGILLAVNLISDHFGPLVAVSPPVHLLPSRPFPACDALTPAAASRSPLAEGVRMPPPPRRAAAAGDRAPRQAPARAGEEHAPHPHPAQLRPGLLVPQRQAQARMQIPFIIMMICDSTPLPACLLVRDCDSIFLSCCSGWP